MKTIIEMAREAGIGWGEKLEGMPDFLEAFAAMVREDERNRMTIWTPENWTDYERSIAAAEREACEIAIEELLPDADRGDCAAAIRARGKA